MTERPILFSAPMVCALLSGAKTQTRRIVNMRDVGFIGGKGEESEENDPNAWGYYAEGRSFSGWMVLARGVNESVGNNQDRASIRCPHSEAAINPRPSSIHRHSRDIGHLVAPFASRRNIGAERFAMQGVTHVTSMPQDCLSPYHAEALLYDALERAELEA